jgi:hypothetical protein
MRSCISFNIAFYLILIIITSLILSSQRAVSPTAAKASLLSNMQVSSKIATGTTQLPLPTGGLYGIISQITSGQDGVVSTSGSGSVTSINSQGQDGVVSASGLGSVVSINRLGNRIQGLSLSPDSTRSGNVINCRPVIPCIGTNRADIIMAGISEQVFGRKGNDMIFGAADDQLYGDGGNDIILVGIGNSLADGGSGDDVLTAGVGHSLLIGGPGNDKLFAGPGDTVMAGGKGANHFDCPASVAGLARSIVLDYNPANGDTISGQCTLVNNVGPSGGAGQATPLPDSGETSSGSSPGTEGVIASSGAGGTGG